MYLKSFLRSLSHPQMSLSTLQPLSGPGLSLPVEVLEMVLSQLPYTFLITTCTSVCKHWRDVIMNPVVSGDDLLGAAVVCDV